MWVTVKAKPSEVESVILLFEFLECDETFFVYLLAEDRFRLCKSIYEFLIV